jgi:Putative Flp pilus-assembly TadE/G-like
MRDMMAWLTRLIRSRLRRDERGAVAVIVALLIGGGVLTGMGALVIDVGQLYQERGELQNGADAGALGVAKSCALGSCTPAVASQLADGNASSLTGGTAGVPLVCGSGSLGSCPPSTGTLTDCPPPPPAGTNFVDVHTATLTAGGSTLLPPVFAGTLLGNSSYQGTNVQACAQAEWGPPAAATTVALTISACEWDLATQQGTSFAPAPPYPEDPEPAASFDQVLTADPGNGDGCGTEAAGADGPGTFGWAADATGNCTLPVSGSSFPVSAGGSMSPACQTVLQDAQQDQIPILVPVYVSVTDPADPTYLLQGFAEFVVTGYNLPGGFAAEDWLDSANSCQSTTYCVNGYFVQAVIPSTGSISGPSLGASIIDLTG